MLSQFSKITVTDGPHRGRTGRVVSSPWIGNLWHFWIDVNVPATDDEIRAKYGAGYGKEIDTLISNAKQGFGPRSWITVRASQANANG